MKPTTYARARLMTGITGVGALVVLSTILLFTDVPEKLLGGRGGTPGTDALTLALALGAAALFVLPFDLLGGLVWPRRFGRPSPSNGKFAVSWLRGVFVLIAISSCSGSLLIAAGRAGGRPAALFAFVALASALILFQELVARLVGGLRRSADASEGLEGLDVEAKDVVLLDGDDPGFSGGFSGPTAKLVLPRHWFGRLKPETLALLVERRQHIRRSGAWRKTLVLAVLWNAAGFLAASTLPRAGVESVAQLVTTGLGFTLWTFIGLLLLPTPSRRATMSVDARVVNDVEEYARLASVVLTLDRLQDDEPERSAGVESIFHPIPSVSRRVGALTSGQERSGGVWHLARTALYLSHVGLSLLPRAVHCNVGRPELWVYLPADG